MIDAAIGIGIGIGMTHLHVGVEGSDAERRCKRSDGGVEFVEKGRRECPSGS